MDDGRCRTRPDFEGVNVERRGGEDSASSGRLGLLLQDVPPALAQERQLPVQGALVADVTPGSPAERAGLVPGMVIVEARGRRVTSAAELKRLLREARPGEPVLLRVQLEGRTVCSGRSRFRSNAWGKHGLRVPMGRAECRIVIDYRGQVSACQAERWSEPSRSP